MVLFAPDSAGWHGRPARSSRRRVGSHRQQRVVDSGTTWSQCTTHHGFGRDARNNRPEAYATTDELSMPQCLKAQPQQSFGRAV